jgi:hypothetical protein
LRGIWSGRITSNFAIYLLTAQNSTPRFWQDNEKDFLKEALIE